jgi:D-glycero-beta-D-manno-heptose 1-phosphate adenylyltransferase
MRKSSLPLIFGRQNTADFLEKVRAQKRRIVFVNGCFDLLHPGHVQVFFDAKKHGDCLVVGLNSDTSIQRIKGPNRPILPENVRLTMVSALKPVDACFCFDEENASEAIRFVKPDVYAKGAQYENQPYPESDAVAENQVNVVYLNQVEGFSTSNIIERIQRSEQQP